MNQAIDYDSIIKILPPHIKPAYDGMIIDFSSGKVDIYDKFLK